MMLKKTALTLALSIGFVASASAFTNVSDLGTVGPDEFFLSTVNRTGSFQDQVKFTVGPESLISSGTVTNVTLTNVFGINNFSAILYLSDGTLWYDLNTDPLSTPKTKFGEGPLDANTAYYFVISGDTTGTKGGRYSYDVLTTAVPEPESYALFLAGLGIMGAIARRRSKVAV